MAGHRIENRQLRTKNYIKTQHQKSKVMPMNSPKISFRLESALYEEVSRIAAANGKNMSEAARLLIESAVIRRSEEMTDTQLQLVERRLNYIEKRFSAFLVKIAKSAARTEYFASTILLESAGTDEQGMRLREFFRDEAEIFAVKVLKMKSKEEADSTDFVLPVNKGEAA
jgi:hypothetical protein